jgi:hypothetical protein
MVTVVVFSISLARFLGLAVDGDAWHGEKLSSKRVWRKDVVDYGYEGGLEQRIAIFLELGW